MPGSSSRGKFDILNWRRSLPVFKYVLDIGPGWGTYAKLLKRKGEVWHAVEIHEPYINKFKLNNFYDKIFIENIVDFTHTEKFNSYDLVIMGDIIEHLSKEDGIATLRKVLAFSKYCIISLPLDEETQTDQENNFEHWQNPHERHLARWSNSGFIKTIQDVNGELIAMAKYYELAVYLVSSKNNDNFLTESMSSFDYIKHKKINLDPGKNMKQRIKERIPSFIKKPFKYLFK